MSQQKKVLLVTGATGKQGGAVIDNLLQTPQTANDFTILGVTRNKESPGAKKLAAKSDLIKIVQGDFNDTPGLFKSASAITFQPVWGVFSVQTPMGSQQSLEQEEKYGKALVDESLAHNVQHFVYTSVDRGGDDRSWTNPTPVPHFRSKHAIELHLKSRAADAGGKMGWTILRPTAFMENFAPGFATKVFMAAWRDTLGPKPLQLISTHDIGAVAARAFADPGAWRGKAVGLAGDDLTREQVEEVMRRRTGKEMGATFGVLGSAFLYFVADMGKMMRWFKTDGYGVDIPRLRQVHPGLLSFERWLETRSPYEVKKE